MAQSEARTLFEKVWQAHLVRPETDEAPAVAREARALPNLANSGANYEKRKKVFALAVELNADSRLASHARSARRKLDLSVLKQAAGGIALAMRGSDISCPIPPWAA